MSPDLAAATQLLDLAKRRGYRDTIYLAHLIPTGRRCSDAPESAPGGRSAPARLPQLHADFLHGAAISS